VAIVSRRELREARFDFSINIGVADGTRTRLSLIHSQRARLFALGHHVAGGTSLIGRVYGSNVKPRRGYPSFWSAWKESHLRFSLIKRTFYC
jgi:hypothetical protein